MKSLPTQVKVGAVVYDVYTVARLRDESMFGQLVRTEAAIELHPEMSPYVQEVTLYHELIHALLCHAGIASADQEERIIAALAHGFVALVHDNPDLFIP